MSWVLWHAASRLQSLQFVDRRANNATKTLANNVDDPVLSINDFSIPILGWTGTSENTYFSYTRLSSTRRSIVIMKDSEDTLIFESLCRQSLMTLSLMSLDPLQLTCRSNIIALREYSALRYPLERRCAGKSSEWFLLPTGYGTIQKSWRQSVWWFSFLLMSLIVHNDYMKMCLVSAFCRVRSP